LKVYLVAGLQMHESMAGVLSGGGYEVMGHEYTIDAAAIVLKKSNLSPDLLIINGLAQVSGAARGEVNRNQSLLVKLKEIRMAVPRSRILLLLPGGNPPDLIHRIVALGIYDIRQASSFDGPTLIGWINQPMSIADFDGFASGRVSDHQQGEIKYSEVPEGQKPPPQKNKSQARRKQAGKPSAVLAVGDAGIEQWIRDNFSDQLEVLACGVEPAEIKSMLEGLAPDICILMRRSSLGGVPGAGELAVWAAQRVPALLFIVGELDREGNEMAARAMEAGVGRVISCDPGGYISGDELVYVLTGMIREMREGGEVRGRVTDPAGAGGELNSLLRGAGLLARVIKQSAQATARKGKSRQPAKKAGPGIDLHQGLPLVDEASPGMPGLPPGSATSIVPGGILSVVSPWRPGLAGRISAQAVKILGEVEGSQVAYVGASAGSTGAVWLEITDEELLMSDWRVPGSGFPISRDNLKIYAVDPLKDLRVEGETDLWSIIKEARKTSTYTVVDFAEDLAAARKAARQGRSVVLVVLPGSDPVEYKISSLWLRNFAEGRQNVITGIDLRGVPGSGIPEGIRPGVVIRNSPADALAVALKQKGQGQFEWN